VDGRQPSQLSPHLLHSGRTSSTFALEVVAVVEQGRGARSSALGRWGEDLAAEQLAAGGPAGARPQLALRPR
jgi:hypothetical protein